MYSSFVFVAVSAFEPTLEPTIYPISQHSYSPTLEPTLHPSLHSDPSSSYLFIDKALNFMDAQLYCRKHIGTDLASIHSNDDFEKAKATIGNIEHIEFVWIGLHRLNTNNEQIWQWTDDSQWDYGTNVAINDRVSDYPWIRGEPNNEGSTNNEQCVELKSSQNYRWNDESCDYKRAFLCRYNQTNNPTKTPTFNPSLSPTKSPTNTDNIQCGETAMIEYDQAHSFSFEISVVMEFVGNIIFNASKSEIIIQSIEVYNLINRLDDGQFDKNDQSITFYASSKGRYRFSCVGQRSGNVHIAVECMAPTPNPTASPIFNEREQQTTQIMHLSPTMSTDKDALLDGPSMILLMALCVVFACCLILSGIALFVYNRHSSQHGKYKNVPTEENENILMDEQQPQQSEAIIILPLQPQQSLSSSMVKVIGGEMSVKERDIDIDKEGDCMTGDEIDQINAE